MDRNKAVVPLVTLLIASLVAVSPSLAKSAQVPLDVLEVSCVQVPGMTWVSGEMFHLRAQMSQSVLYDPDTLEVLGGNTIIGNANLNQVTGHGVFFGLSSGVYLPVSATGTFDGHWTLNVHPGDVTGQAMAHGTGEVEGQMMKVRLVGISGAEAAALLQELAALGRLPCPLSSVAGITHDFGVILDSRSE